jgi:hypothetical protein
MFSRLPNNGQYHLPKLETSQRLFVVWWGEDQKSHAPHQQCSSSNNISPSCESTVPDWDASKLWLQTVWCLHQQNAKGIIYGRFHTKWVCLFLSKFKNKYVGGLLFLIDKINSVLVINKLSNTGPLNMLLLSQATLQRGCYKYLCFYTTFWYANIAAPICAKLFTFYQYNRYTTQEYDFNQNNRTYF